MIIYIPIKQNSQRVPNKNFRLFNGKPLWEHTVDKFSDPKYKLFIDTDSEEIIDQCHSKNVTAFKRPTHLRGDTVSVVDLLKNFREFLSKLSLSGNICQIHVTSPFLDITHVDFAFSKMENDGYDSVFAADVMQTRFWRKEEYGYCPVNHNPMKLEQTQDLPKYYCENSYLYAFQQNVLDINNRIGYNPYILEVGYPHNLDIDTESDWNYIKNIK
jgi:CMP-N-acetylneuraminic acid synthetase|tara:strand:- start:246 stop:890 length:645 start_codon:yes stop_codon:yes gene_type:complete